MLKSKLVKSVLNKHKKRDSWFLDEFSINPYEGCSCNCQYCYIRGSKYGINMENGLFVKQNAPEVLDKQLSVRLRKKQFGIIAIGSATDAYIHQEAKELITRRILEVILKYKFPVFISTKNKLILRDVDLLESIDKSAILPEDLSKKLNRGAILSVSLSTLDEKISNRLEPGAAPPIERLLLVRDLKKKGFLVGVNAIPLLPFISDTEAEMEKIIITAKKYDADYILTGGLTLFGNGIADSKTLYNNFLEQFDSSLLKKYEILYGNNFYTSFTYQNKLKEISNKLCKRHGIRNSILTLNVKRIKRNTIHSNKKCHR